MRHYHAQRKKRMMKISLTLVSSLLLTAAHIAHADTASPTQISNTASASYTDSSSGSHTATSNTVTAGQRMPGVAMAAGTSKTVAAGSSVMFAHSVTNTGNAPESYKFSETNGGDFSLAGVAFYADANGYSIPDSARPITSVDAVAPGATFYFVAVVTLPPDAAIGGKNTMVISATSALSNTVQATSTDTVASGPGLVLNRR